MQGTSMVINGTESTLPVTAPNSAERRRVQADADYARQLQAKIDAKEMRAANRGCA